MIPRQLAGPDDRACWRQNTRYPAILYKPLAYCGLIAGHVGPCPWEKDAANYPPPLPRLGTRRSDR